MNTPMDESEIQAMNNSFKILHERRRKLLDNEETGNSRKGSVGSGNTPWTTWRSLK